MKLTFTESKDSNYKARTIENAASADATIAFAANFESSGEILTKNSVINAQKIYIPFDLTIPVSELYVYIKHVIDIFQTNNVHTLNIAGNGLSRLVNFNISQTDCDNYVYEVLRIITAQVNITSIRSGGQTGADESGIKAAQRLNIDAICHAPKGWRFRTETTDYKDEKLFKQRFN